MAFILPIQVPVNPEITLDFPEAYHTITRFEWNKNDYLSIFLDVYESELAKSNGEQPVSFRNFLVFTPNAYTLTSCGFEEQAYELLTLDPMSDYYGLTQA